MTAATLSVEIKTDVALQRIAELELSLAKLGTSDTSSAQPPRAVQSISSAVKAAEGDLNHLKQFVAGYSLNIKHIDAQGMNPVKGISEAAKKEFADLRKTVDTQNAQIAALMASGSAKIANAIKVGQSAGAGSMSGSFDALKDLGIKEETIAAFQARLKKLGMESAFALEAGWTTSNFNKSNQVLAALEQNTSTSLNKIVRMSQEAQRMVSTHGGEETARSTYGDKVVDGTYAAKAQRQLDTQKAKIALASRNQALLDTVNSSTTSLVAEMRTANAARQKAEANSIAVQWIAENQDALQKDSIAQNVKARLLARNKAIVSGVEASTAQLIADMRTANAARQKAERTVDVADGRRSMTLDTQQFKVLFNSSKISEAAQIYNDQGKSIYAAKIAVEQYGVAAAKAMLGTNAYLVDNINRLDQFKRKLREVKVPLDGLSENQKVTAASARTYGNFLHATPSGRQAIIDKVDAASMLTMDEAIKRYGRGVAGLTPVLGDLISKHKQLGGSIKNDLNPHLADTHALLRGAARGIGELWLSWGQHVPQMVASFAVVASARKAMQEGMAFSYQSRFVETLGSSIDKASIQSGILSVSADTGRGASELTRALRVLQQTGVDAAAGIKILDTVVKASVLGEVDMKEATEGLANSLEVFGLHSEDPEIYAANFRKAGDLMAYVAKETKASLGDVAKSFQNVTGIAEKYNVSMTDAAYVVKELGKSGIVGAKAGTMTGSFLESVYTPSSQGSMNLRKTVGYESIDKDTQEYKKLDVVLTDLFKIVLSFKKEDQGTVLRTLVPVSKGGKAFSALFNEYKKDIGEALSSGKQINEAIAEATANLPKAITKQSEDSVGLLDKGYKNLQKEAQQQLAELKGAWDTAFAVAGQDALHPLIGTFSTLKELVSDPGFAAGLSMIAGGIANLGMLAAENAGVVAMLGTTMVGAFSGRAIGGAIAWLIPALGGIAGPIGAISGALIAGGVAWYTWANASEEAANKVKVSAANAAADIAKMLRDTNEDFDKMSKAGIKSVVRNAGDKYDQTNGQTIGMQKKLSKDYDIPMQDLMGDIDIDKLAKPSAKWGTIGLEGKRNALQALKEANAETKAAFDNLQGIRARYDQKPEDPVFDPKVPNGTKSLAELLKAQKDAAATAAKAAKGGDRFEQKDERAKFNDNVSSSMEREKLKLNTDMLAVEQALAEQSINSTEAAYARESINKQSLLTQQSVLEGYLNEAAARGDAVSLQKIWNDLRSKGLEITAEEAQRKLELTRIIKAEQNAILDIQKTSARHLEDMAEEKAMYGKTAFEVAKLRIEKERLREIDDVDTRLARNEITPEKATAEKKAINSKSDATLSNKVESRSWVSGMDSAFKEYEEAANNAAANSKKFFQDAASGMTDALTEFVMTGKLSFSNLIQSMIANLIKFQMQKVVASGMSAAGDALGSAAGGLMGSLFAKGGAFEGTAQKFANGGAFTNSIVSQPTFFKFANGSKFGQMGEAGPEAVMPLTRDSAGRLGVRSQGGQSSGGDNVVITINVASDGTATTTGNPQDWGRMADRVRGVVREEMATQRRPGGMLYA
jgi:lambda family phage tail tape measure protein/TP901 family phage tail tape measure protein